MPTRQIRLWIDDVRLPPAGWEWAKTSEEAMQLITNEDIEIIEISFDHDLGGDDDTRRVMYHFAETNTFPPVIWIHSANSVGVDWLYGTASRYSSSVVHVGFPPQS